MYLNFDAYHRWLGIPPKDQPPNHYRLLGIDLFENDPEVIANAADQRMVHVRSFQQGAQSALSQRILNELAAARVCLLSPESKGQYDRELRLSLATRRTGSQMGEVRCAPPPLPVVARATAPLRDLPAEEAIPVADLVRRREPGRPRSAHCNASHGPSWASVMGIAAPSALVAGVTTLALLPKGRDEPPVVQIVRDTPQGAASNMVESPCKAETNAAHGPSLESTDRAASPPGHEEAPGGSLGTARQVSEPRPELELHVHAPKATRMPRHPLRLPQSETASIDKPVIDSRPFSSASKTPAQFRLPADRFVSVNLPWGKELFSSSMEISKEQLKSLFPRDAQVWIEKHPNDAIQSITTHDDGKLSGPCATFHENGKLRVLAKYDSSGYLHGPLRVCAEDGSVRLFAEYARGRKSGVVCLLDVDTPLLIQQWNNGALAGEYFFKFTSEGWQVLPLAEISPAENAAVRTAAEELAAIETRVELDELDRKQQARARWRQQEKELRQMRASQLSVNKRKASSQRIQMRRAEDARAMDGMWNNAVRRSGL